MAVKKRAATLAAVKQTTAAAPAVTIRRATVDEAHIVADVYLASRRAAAPYVPRTIHSTEEVHTWFAKTVLVEHEVWIAEVGGRIVAVMVLRGESVDQLYVLRADQRRGIGSQLLAQAKRLRRVLRLYAFQSNEPARAFYEKHGFTAVAFGDGTGNEEGEPDVLYEWRGPGSLSRRR
jgi:ribosomal protein S18 acetylase RimI-like enzyme